ncbi:hypothetical protein BTVI_64781 [Pitangus sulphuratus]|nr:hypothetical protein BTVI_64781 [Pitangus sulphuratus]
MKKQIGWIGSLCEVLTRQDEPDHFRMSCGMDSNTQDPLHTHSKLWQVLAHLPAPTQGIVADVTQQRGGKVSPMTIPNPSSIRNQTRGPALNVPVLLEGAGLGLYRLSKDQDTHTQLVLKKR